MLSHGLYLCVHPDVRLLAPDGPLRHSWKATKLGAHVDVDLDLVDLLVISRFAIPSTIELAVSDLQVDYFSIFNLDFADVQQRIENLKRNSLLVVHEDSRCQIKKSAIPATECFWSDEYIRASYDYPFIDGSEIGRDEAAKRMCQYALSCHDGNRIKSYQEALVRIPLLCDSANSGVADSVTSRETLLKIAGLTGGAVGRMNPKWNGAPLLKRTSPSGGARHPTEVYFAVDGICNLNNGWYHVQSDPATAELIDPDFKCFPVEILLGTAVARSTLSQRVGAVIFSSVVKRNMFRYREIRTYRSIHLDAGHVMETCCLLLRAAGFKVEWTYDIDEVLFQKLTKLGRLEEAFMSCLLFGR